MGWGWGREGWGKRNGVDGRMDGWRGTLEREEVEGELGGTLKPESIHGPKRWTRGHGSGIGERVIKTTNPSTPPKRDYPALSSINHPISPIYQSFTKQKEYRITVEQEAN
jgi:hypothetical protein